MDGPRIVRDVYFHCSTRRETRSGPVYDTTLAAKTWFIPRKCRECCRHMCICTTSVVIR